MPTAANFAAATQTAENIYRVPEKAWQRWTSSARALFNHLFGTCQENKSIYGSTEVFRPQSEGEETRVNGVIDATAWNLSWAAAEFVSGITKNIQT